MTASEALRRHWPEYLIEGWALGMFMIAAGVVATLLEYPGSPVHAGLPDASVRRIIAGMAMGLTAIGLIYSPWGKRSGAHMNPSVTVTFLILGKVRAWDALFYVLAQFLGGTAGVLFVLGLIGAPFSEPPVRLAATLPGPAGSWAAFTAELAISAGMMATILTVSGSRRIASLTGIVAGCLVATYISLEAPLSGMSMNPARSFASAVPALMWRSLWIYFTAPVAGMLAGAQLYRLSRRRVACAKLVHPPEVRCIHCGYEPRAAGALSIPTPRSLHP